MNGRFQMQGGKNWILPKQINANRFFWDSHWLEIWSNHFCPSMGLNGGTVAMDSEGRDQGGCRDQREMQYRYQTQGLNGASYPQPRSLHSVPQRDKSGLTRFPANESPRRTGFRSSLSAKTSFYLPAFEISRSCPPPMSTIPKRKRKRSDIEANYRNKTKTF